MSAVEPRVQAAINAAAGQMCDYLQLTQTDQLPLSNGTFALVVFDGGILCGEITVEYSSDEDYDYCNVIIAGEHIHQERYDRFYRRFSEFRESLSGARYYTD